MKSYSFKREHAHWWVIAIAIVFGIAVFFAYDLHAF